MNRRCGRSAIGVLSLALAVLACQKGDSQPPPSLPPLLPEPRAATSVRDAGAAGADAVQAVKAGSGAIMGTATLVGKPPEMKMQSRGADPFCARTPTKDEEVVVGKAGGLKNVLVRITKGLSGNYEPPMTNATLDQSGCMYRPRVQVMMSGQSLLIRNSDQTLHNIHSYKGASTLFNQAEIPGLPPIAKKFNTAGDIIKFKCDVHPWMTGYVAVSSHPFNAVTGDDGMFAIPKVPAGTYTLEAWHERFGTKTSEITVKADAPNEVSFQFQAK